MRRVLFVYRYVPQYRVGFYQGLRAFLARHDVELNVAYGQPTEAEKKKSDEVHLPWTTPIRNTYLTLRGRQLIYQPVVKMAPKYDLVIVEQANKLIVNPILLIMNKLGLAKVAYWGHGKDFQNEELPFAAAVKKFLVRHVYWWFAYNDMSAKVVAEAGFPDSRTTRFMNSIDTDILAGQLKDVTDAEVAEQRALLGLKGDNVCIYIGGMYHLKRIPFLLKALDRIRAKVPDFEMVFLGGGVEKAAIDEFAATREWVKVRGPTFGRDKALNLKMSKLLLMPGLVGLAIIDTFVAETPIVTTNIDIHSPEIDYMINGVNGEMTPDPEDVEAYADRVASVLQDPAHLERLRAGCREAAKIYTQEAMVERAGEGILKAIGVR